MIKSYYDLRVYNESYRLALIVHKNSKSFPKFERYELGAQIRKAATSIPANIAEGYGGSSAEFKRFLRIASGSCNEVRVYLEMAKDLGYLEEIKSRELSLNYEELSKQLYSLRNKWR